jgi:hypothetical protein
VGVAPCTDLGVFVLGENIIEFESDEVVLENIGGCHTLLVPIFVEVDDITVLESLGSLPVLLGAPHKELANKEEK